MSQIVIGKHNHKNVAIDITTLLATRLLVTADSGGGKTVLLKRIIEQAFDKIRIIVIDPEGEFAPMREKFDFVLATAGKGGETEIHPRSAALLALRLRELHASCICDISELKPSLRHEWVKLFLEGLVETPKSLWKPCLVIVDEAHMFCPEKGKGDSIAIDSMTALCTRGRKRMLVPCFATQRLASLSKDASSMLLNRLIGPTFETINRKRAADELSVPKDEMAEFYKEIQLLDPGNFFALGRAISRERILVKIGEITTPHGQEAMKYAIEPPPAPDEIKALLPKLADLPKTAEEKARTEKELRREIADLKQQIRHIPVAATSSGDTLKLKKQISSFEKLLEDVVKVLVKINAVGFDNSPIQPDEIKRALEETAKRISIMAENSFRKRSEELERFKREADRLIAKIKPLLSDMEVNVEVRRNEPFTVTPEPKRPHIALRPSTSNGNGDIPVGERAILIAAAQYPDGVDRDQLSVLTGYKRSSRDAYVSRLITKSYVRLNGSLILPTQEGVDALGSDYEPLPSGEDLRDYWLRKLPLGEKKILECLLRYGNSPVDREGLDEETGYKRSSRD